MRYLSIILNIMFIIFPTISLAQVKGDYEPTSNTTPEKTLSPYFYIPSEDKTLDVLPLKNTKVEVNIAGIIADVTVTQEYKNQGTKPLEAIYIFPASTRAAVYAMQFTLGTRTIKAQIEEKQKARAQYEEAKKIGKTASLLEQQRPNVFQMNVANIMPGDIIKVEMKYTEYLTSEKGVYEFMFPTVVGPRYSNTPEDKATDKEKWLKNPYHHEGDKGTATFTLQAKVNGGIVVEGINSPSHEVKVTYSTKTSVNVATTNNMSGNKDFILHYSLTGKEIQSGILTYETPAENYFAFLLEPPKSVPQKSIPAKEYVFIVDVSGSMQGFPLDIAKNMLTTLLQQLRPEDSFNLLLFSGGNSLLSEGMVPANKDNIDKALQLLSKQYGGGTELLPALKKAINIPKETATSRSIIIFTDGYVSVEKEAFDLIKTSLGKANLFAVGVGTAVNRYLIEGMARAGNGDSFIAFKREQGDKIVAQLNKIISAPVLTNINVKFNGFTPENISPASYPDLFAEKPLVIFGKYHGKTQGKILVTGKTPQGDFSIEKIMEKPSSKEENSALKYLWARAKVAEMADYNNILHTAESTSAIVKLGLEYSLLTDYTSFIAIDTEIRNKDGKSTTVKQPLPLPEGVSDLAVGEQKTSFAPMNGGFTGMQKSSGMRLQEMAPPPNASADASSIKSSTTNAPTPPTSKKIKEIKIKVLTSSFTKSDETFIYKSLLEYLKNEIPKLNSPINFELKLEINKGEITKVKTNKLPESSAQKSFLKELQLQFKFPANLNGILTFIIEEV